VQLSPPLPGSGVRSEGLLESVFGGVEILLLLLMLLLLLPPHRRLL